MALTTTENDAYMVNKDRNLEEAAIFVAVTVSALAITTQNMCQQLINYKVIIINFNRMTGNHFGIISARFYSSLTTL